ncbi:GNAT family N-acetyltransferase [Microbacterium deminutum]|uniref:GNAT family N-acetyltransferase n=1 Tax=Microbacterium deminutum TaxID=344164 RepID=UPI0031E3A143
MAWTVVEVSAAQTYPLRQELLREDRTDLDLHIPDDDTPGAFHLAVKDDADRIVGVATVVPATPEFPAAIPAWRLRQMAVTPRQQGAGIGTALLGAALSRVRALGGATLWAEARDSSLGFYLAHGMQPVPGRHHRVAGVAYSDVVLSLAKP